MSNLTDTEAAQITAYYREAGEPSVAASVIAQLADASREKIERVLAVATPSNAADLRAHNAAADDAAEPKSDLPADGSTCLVTGDSIA